ncbi:MAG: hypothetical protein ACI8RP_000369 [Urechidicola sp.]|jgi:hypothetical protein|tara:strand:+ start:8 stop:406 length:399 start_codon:yes stop_codon:yes gene_type:complete
MPYQDVFVLFWEQVKESVQEGRFAKLTMAKTIGKPNLKNIFLRPVYSKDGFKVLLKLRYRSKETEDEEDELTLEEAFLVLKSHLVKSFSSVLLFTTTKDVSFKINKKGAGSITENSPSFHDVTQAKNDVEQL